jgi:hypothetical protein
MLLKINKEGAMETFYPASSPQKDQ